jgi:hypothetical protein
MPYLARIEQEVDRFLERENETDFQPVNHRMPDFYGISDADDKKDCWLLSQMGLQKLLAPDCI